MKSTIGFLVAVLSLTVVPAVALAGGSPPAPPEVYVGADVDGDGKSDLVVEDSTTGFSIASLLDGVNPRTGVGVIPGTNVGAGYTTAGYPDLNGDGKSDLLVGDFASVVGKKPELTEDWDPRYVTCAIAEIGGCSPFDDLSI